MGNTKQKMVFTRWARSLVSSYKWNIGTLINDLINGELGLYSNRTYRS